eukprot:TRINITY_DN13133_c0_g1_i1.p1 TRINITY_DN13133_c0_g1~~TRINITY_DN13133_c0_g1_i1.p1  ORF type:complete len:493 (-),score=145.43 TRINITY_DN13133_c0_g1_i1:1005-2483(-)
MTGTSNGTEGAPTETVVVTETVKQTVVVTETDPEAPKESVDQGSTEAADVAPVAEGEAEEAKAETVETDKTEGEEKPAKKGRKKAEKVFTPPPFTGRPQRERKSLERFSVEDSRDKTADVNIKPGTGTPLKDIPAIAATLSKLTRNDDILGMVHTILFGKKVKAQLQKKNILEFSGYPWKENEQTKERGKVKEKLERYTKEGLHHLLEIFDLPKGGKKDDQIERVLDFLKEPSSSAKPASGAKSGKKAAKADDEAEEADAATAPKTSPEAPVSKKRKAPLKDASLRKKMKELLSEAPDDATPMSLDRVTQTLGTLFTGDIQTKADLIKELYSEFVPEAPKPADDAPTVEDAAAPTEAATAITTTETVTVTTAVAPDTVIPDVVAAVVEAAVDDAAKTADAATEAVPAAEAAIAAVESAAKTEAVPAVEASTEGEAVPAKEETAAEISPMEVEKGATTEAAVEAVPAAAASTPAENGGEAAVIPEAAESAKAE